jgi:hypothetical protein
MLQKYIIHFFIILSTCIEIELNLLTNNRYELWSSRYVWDLITNLNIGLLSLCNIV